jgi:hypothetical protein
MANDKIDFNALGQSLDTTWGRSSTPKTASYSVKISMSGPDRLIASYAAIVNFGTERQMIEMKRRYEVESNDIIAEVMKHVKTNYKDLAGSSLTIKEVGTQDNIEVIAVNIYNPKRTAYYRRKTVFEIA